jgi:gliding motility-associated-like protein
MGYSTDHFLNIGLPDTMMYLSKYDLETNTLTPFCQYWMGDLVSNTNMTSPLEFLASDPECDLLIDLDRDNSTGVYPYDYLDSTFYCGLVEAPICDPDVYIHSSAPLDSIIIIISGLEDHGDEQLTSIGLPSSVNLTQLNDSTYVLKSTNPTDDNFKLALSSLRYRHSGIQHTPGPRRIIVQGFNAIKAGVRISATIQINGLPFAGQDRALLICIDTVIQDMLGMIGGQIGGHWYPPLQTGENVFNSALDMASAYTYVVIDPACGNDTAIVTVHREASAPLDLLGVDQVICPGDTIRVMVTQPAQSILWEDGNTVSTRALTNTGIYWVLLETSGGCFYKDTLIVTDAEIWNPTIQTQDPVCNLANGQIVLNQTEFQQNQSVVVNGVPLTSSTLEALAEGTYQILATSNDGCISQTEVILAAQPALTVTIDTQINIPSGLWEKLEYVEQNNVSLSNVLFDPPSSIRWTGTGIEVYGDTDQQFEITFVDENGCIDIHHIQVFVELEQGIYLPNIFSPASTTGNAIWQPSISQSYQLEVLRIYDRWGNMMFQSTMDASWNGTRDGQECPSGVFVYQLLLKQVNTGERKVIKGDFTLLR